MLTLYNAAYLKVDYQLFCPSLTSNLDHHFSEILKIFYILLEDELSVLHLLYYREKKKKISAAVSRRFPYKEKMLTTSIQIYEEQGTAPNLLKTSIARF